MCSRQADGWCLECPTGHDPFLRPLLVSLLSALGLYAYGLEKMVTRGVAQSYAASSRPHTDRQHRNSLHPGVAADGRPGLSRVVPAADAD